MSAPATVSDLVAAIKSTGLAFRYGYFGSGPGDATDTHPMPRITYRFKLTPGADYAAGKAWHRTARYDVELEEPAKSFDTEKLVSDALDSAGVPWDRYEYTQDGTTEGSHWLQVIWEVTVTED
jgi:hypothetical protein